MSEILISINSLSKVYDNGFKALNNLSLKVKQGEILAMLGPNGAGKTSLISIICGIVKPSSGTVTVDNFDIIKDYRKTRSRIGLVPQELNLESFETVFDTVSYSRGLYGKSPKPEHIEKILKDLSLWDKKDQRLRELSGGMKRRVLIAKALSHEPKILFLDEPTAGVDVELRRDMWMVVDELRKAGVTIILTTHYIEEAEAIADRVAVINQGEIIVVEELRKTGVTIILTTHYIEEAEAIADRVAVINQGEIIVVEDKKELIKKMGHKKLTIELQDKIKEIPNDLSKYKLKIGEEEMSLTYTYNVQEKKTGITNLLQDLKDTGLKLKDLKTEQSSLEKIFVNLVKENNEI